MFGYSLTRPVHNKDYFYDVFDTCEKFRCNIEGWHTESGPGVYEAALEYGRLQETADRACLFKYVVKAVATRYDITPCFMAKPRHGLPGNSGHMHVSLVDADGKNLFARDTPDPDAPWPDVEYLTDTGRHFLAGVLEGLPDVMPMVAPTINSYKRLVENFWAPVTVSWALEHRAASIRLIAPPVSDPGATRLEIRIGGADANPYYVLAAVLALGRRGIDKKLAIPCPPLGKGEKVGGSSDRGIPLAKSLKEGTDRFMRPDSIAREAFGDDFVDHYGGTRVHEIRLWDEAVTDWYVFPSSRRENPATNATTQGGEEVHRERVTSSRARIAAFGGGGGCPIPLQRRPNTKAPDEGRDPTPRGPRGGRVWVGQTSTNGDARGMVPSPRPWPPAQNHSQGWWNASGKFQASPNRWPGRGGRGGARGRDRCNQTKPCDWQVSSRRVIVFPWRDAHPLGKKQDGLRRQRHGSIMRQHVRRANLERFRISPCSAAALDGLHRP